jgi:TonB family protein
LLAPDDEARALKALRYSLASDIVELVVLTGDEAFLKTLREAVGPARRLWHVPSGDKVGDLLVAGSVGILVLDVQALLEAPGVFVGQIKRQFPDLVIMVAGPREAEATLAKLISAGTVYRFIHKPVSPARARLFADAAVKRFDDVRQHSSGGLAVLALPGRGRSSRRLLLLGVCALAVALGALASLRLLHDITPPPVRVRATSTGVPTAPPLDAQAQRAAVNAAQQAQAEGALAQQLSRALEPHKAPGSSAAAGAAGSSSSPASAASAAGAAPGPASSTSAQGPNPAHAGSASAAPASTPRRSAELAALALARADEGHFVEPPGDSAQGYLRAALKAGPRDPAALEAQQSVASKLLAAVRTAIDRRDFETARRLLDAAEGIATPQNIGNLRSLLASAQRPQDSDRGQQLLVLAQERLQQDHLLEPAQDSARFYLTTLRELDPAYPGLTAATQDLDARLVTRARGQLVEKRYESARALIAQATADGYSSPDAVTVLRELDSTPAVGSTGAGPTTSAGPAAGSAGAGPTPTSAAPAGQGGSTASIPSGAAAGSSSPQVVSASELTLLKSVQPVYPRRAEEQSTEGWVDLEFTVDERGAVRELRVVQGLPNGVFDGAARTAVAQWRYQPVMRDGHAVSQRARLRIRFSLQH